LSLNDKLSCLNILHTLFTGKGNVPRHPSLVPYFKFSNPR